MDSTEKKQKKEIAAHEVQLPWELVEEILSRVPPKYLVPFRIVCKRWNAILDDKTFINNHKETFRFILKTESKIYSVSIDPKIVVRVLTMDIPSGLESQIPTATELVDCDEFLICVMDKGAAVWNPWLKQSTWISQPSFTCCGIGYDSDRRPKGSVYKTIWSSTEWKIHEFSSGTWKDVVVRSSGSNHGEKRRRPSLHSASGVSLNGFLFWIVFTAESDPFYRLVNFDFSDEAFYRFCDLPCGMSHPLDALVLRVYKRDRFSVLKQCHVTKKIEIWVTKNKVNVKDRDDVVWMNFMTFSIPNFPCLVPTGSNSQSQQPSYFMDDKRLVVCSCDESGKAWIYVLGENKLMSKVKLDSVVDPWPLHCTYFPNLVPVPGRQRYEAELQI